MTGWIVAFVVSAVFNVLLLLALRTSNAQTDEALAGLADYHRTLDTLRRAVEARQRGEVDP